MWEAIRPVVALAFIGLLSFMLAMFIRGWISEWKTRGAESRLRHPDPEGIEEFCGFPPPAELVEFYRNVPWVESGEFELADTSKAPPAVWFIMGFIPLTALDVREQKWIGNVPGIPIAYALEGVGMYYIAANGAVMLDSRDLPEKRVQVAANISEFGKFAVREPQTEDEEDNLSLR